MSAAQNEEYVVTTVFHNKFTYRLHVYERTFNVDTIKNKGQEQNRH